MRLPCPALLCSLLLVACTGGTEGPLGPTGTASLTITGGPSGDEEVELTVLGWSEIAEDPGAVLTATDDSGVHELMILVDEAVEGTQVPRRLRYRKGLQVLLDHAADCTVDLRQTSDPDQPWAGDFSCSGLVAEDREGTREDYGIEGGSFSGGSTRYLAVRNEAFQGQGFTFGVALEDLEGTELSTQESDAGAVVIPWRGDEVWVLLEDQGEAGGADTVDDVVIKLDPEPGELLVDKWVRAAAREDALVLLDIASTEGLELTVSVEDSSVPAETGESVSLTLWAGLQHQPDERRVFID